MDQDYDELLSESSTENEEQCSTTNKSIQQNQYNSKWNILKKNILFWKVLLVLSSVWVFVLLPLYMEAVNVTGDVYSFILTNTIYSATILSLFSIILKFISYKHFKISKLPSKLLKLLCLLSVIYFVSVILIVFSTDRKRVVCHLQDPIKALLLLWSFIYYFFFSKRSLCLKQIFFVTVILIGLFIAVDYSMSNEFKCRGYERQHVTDEKGEWSSKTHTIWILVYIGGLALYAAYFTIMESNLANMLTVIRDTHVSPGPVSACSSTDDVSDETSGSKKINVVDLCMWIHIFGVIIVVVLYFLDFIPCIGKDSNATIVFNYTLNGFLCPFTPSCNHLYIISPLFLFGYIIFFVTSLQFLMLTQSAVYTVATMSTAIPLLQLWWSLFNMVPVQNGLIIWNPAFTGELISAFIGLPIMMSGLYFLYKLHFKE